MPDIFLSYNRDDQAVARRFTESLEREGFTVWWDATLRSGEDYDEVTGKALKAAKAVVVLWSKKSVESRWVRTEATIALQRKTLMPVMIEPCERPIMFELSHTTDLSQWKGAPQDSTWQRFVADVRRHIEKDEPSGEQALLGRPHGNVIADHWYRRHAFQVVIVVLPVLIATILIYVYRRAPAPVAQPAATNVTAAPATVSLAVLPFVNLSSDPQQEYFADGLAEELLDELAQNGRLRVIGRTSSFAFKGKNEDLRSIGRQLGVNHLLEGSVRRSGDRIRITAQLISTEDGSRLWSKTYELATSEVFAIQDEVAKSVARALSVTLDVGEIPRAKGGTTNFEAYDRFLRARRESNPLQQAVLLREALKLDPTFSRAWVRLHDELIGGILFDAPHKAAYEAELADVRVRITALAPDAWWTQYIYLTTYTQDRQWAKADVAAKKMMTSAPASEFEALDQYGYFLMCVGRFREAVPFRQRARDAEPLSVNAANEYMTALDGAGLHAESIAEFERSKKLEGYSAAGDVKSLWRIFADKDAPPAAVKAELQITANPRSPLVLLNQALAANFANRTAQLEAVRMYLNDPVVGQNPMSLFAIFKYADYLGDKDMALEALRRSFSLGNIAFPWIWLPIRTDLRSDPRFKQIVRDFGLVDYWRKSGNWGDFCKPIGEADFECK